MKLLTSWIFAVSLWASIPCAGAETVLWQIGKFDDSTEEFAFAPKDNGAYRQPAFYVLGVSDPQYDWPYVQPGTVDGGWAPGTPQTFQVFFALATLPKGACRLVLDFVDTHSIDPPHLKIEVNDKTWEFQTPKGNGVTWVTMDAPMLQFDPIKIAPPFGKEHWREHIDPVAHIYSWTMNNHWETNYKAYQEGKITFRYALRPHPGGYNAVEAQRFGRNMSQPLLAVSANPSNKVLTPFVKVAANGVVVTTIPPSRDGKACMVRLFNVADEEQTVRLAWNRPMNSTWISNPMEDKIGKAPPALGMVPFEIATLGAEWWTQVFTRSTRSS